MFFAASSDDCIGHSTQGVDGAQTVPHESRDVTVRQSNKTQLGENRGKFVRERNSQRQSRDAGI